MPRILVLFHSRTGNTAALADALADGARSVRFAEVDVRRIDDLATATERNANPEWTAAHDAMTERYRTLGSFEELATYDALVLGSPARFGIMSAELKNVLDQTGPLWERGALVNKVGSAFTSAATPHGGHETTLWSIMTTMANLGMIIVPPGYGDALIASTGGPHGAPALSGGGAPGDAERAVARHQGERVAEVTGWIAHARSHKH